MSPPVLWDTCKAVLRGKIIAKAAYLKKLRQRNLAALQLDLQKLEQEHKERPNDKTYQEIRKKTAEINDIYSADIQKKLLFTKQRYYETGSKSTKLLAYKLRKQEARSNIYKIRDFHNKTIRYKTEDIQKCFELYYKQLYDQPFIDNKTDIEAFLDTLSLPKVTEEQNSCLISEITAQEIRSAISKLKVNKSPGADGYSSELFRESLISVLGKTFNWVLKKGEIPYSWQEAIISVMPKEGKDELDCSSYRPISVLNQDYRLFTAILARRIEKLLPSIIQLDQTQDNIRRALYVLQHIKENHTEAMVMGMDAEKAFDSVRWDFLYSVLEKFNFHDIIIRTIKALYTDPTARIKINGSLSNSISLRRGCRQGCSASPLLFAIFLEPLSQSIKQKAQIQGIEIKGTCQKLALFADDVLIFLSSPDTSLPALMSEFAKFGQMSGYKINVQKTQVLTFNYSPSESVKENYDIKWNLKSMKYLGVNLTKDIGQLKSANYNPLISKIKEDITRWNLIPFMTLTTRVEGIKTNVLPRVLYLFQNLPVEILDREFIEWNYFKIYLARKTT